MDLLNKNFLIICVTKKRAHYLFKEWYELLMDTGIRFRAMPNILCVDIIGGSSFKFITIAEADIKTRGFRGTIVHDYEFETYFERAKNEIIARKEKTAKGESSL